MPITGVVGLDLSLSGTGFARIDLHEGTVETWTLSAKAGTVISRAKTIGTRILNLMKPTDIAFIENYAYGIHPRASSVVTLGELGGIIKLLLLQYTGFEPLTFTTSEMRKFCSGKGDIKKEVIPVWTYKRYGRECHSHDECVALILADIGAHVVEVEPEMFPAQEKYQRDIIKRLQKKYLGELQSLAEKLQAARKNT